MFAALFSDIAMAQAAQAPGTQPSMLETLVIPVAGFMIIMLFMVVLPQRKKMKEHDDMLKNLKNGDEVMTTGGLIGRVRSVAETFVTIEIASNTAVKVARAHITGLTTPAAVAAKDKK